jgi:hypothetical protein
MFILKGIYLKILLTLNLYKHLKTLLLIDLSEINKIVIKAKFLKRYKYKYGKDIIALKKFFITFKTNLVTDLDY